tara:strand:- start:611 stop:739 length:129 start_codon:yes stop_codon:yes gene_type:complete
MDNTESKTEWKALAVVAGIWIVTLTLAIVPFDNWGILSGGLV